MAEANLRAEIEALRCEIAAMRAEQAATDKVSGGNMEAHMEAHGETSPNLTDQLRNLAHEISTFTEDAEKNIVEHPLISVLGALVLGILIGRATHR